MVKLFLIIVAGVFLGFVLFVLAVYFFLRYKLRKLFGGLGDALKGLAGAAAMLPPAHIKLLRSENVTWHHPAEVARMTDDLRNLGFTDAGTYLVENDRHDIRFRGLAHEREHIYAAIYDLPSGGPFLDFVARYADGRHLTYTTTAETGLDRPPGKPIHRFTDLSAVELYERFLAALEPIDRDPAPASDFASRAETYYAEEMDWRADRGGLTEAEVRRQAEKAGMTDIDDATITQIRAMFLAQLNEGLDEKLRDAFLATGTVTAAEWNTLQHEVAFIHRRLPEEYVGNAFRAAVGYGDDVDEQITALQRRAVEIGPRDAFAEANAALPADRRFTPLAELTEPVACTVYRNPPALENDDADADQDDSD